MSRDQSSPRKRETDNFWNPVRHNLYKTMWKCTTTTYPCISYSFLSLSLIFALCCHFSFMLRLDVSLQIIGIQAFYYFSCHHSNVCGNNSRGKNPVTICSMLVTVCLQSVAVIYMMGQNRPKRYNLKRILSLKRNLLSCRHIFIS